MPTFADFLRSVTGRKIAGFWGLVLIGAIALFAGKMSDGIFVTLVVPLYSAYALANVMEKKNRGGDGNAK